MIMSNYNRKNDLAYADCRTPNTTTTTTTVTFSNSSWNDPFKHISVYAAQNI